MSEPLEPSSPVVSPPPSVFASFWGAVLFYTMIPLPSFLPIALTRISRWCPLVGLGLGGLLALIDAGLAALGFTPWLRGGLLVALGAALTGGLHLDGVSDTADGLAVTDPAQRLAVMQDSRAGAYGAMAIALVLLLKALALGEMETLRSFALPLALGWGRWGQVTAIAFYPYLKAEGKGAKHRREFCFPQDFLLGSLVLLLFSGLWGYGIPQQGLFILGSTLGSAAIAAGCSAWFAWRLGGHTGDSYGAVVEWSETLILCALTAI
ncbi:MAG: adenosylcobinamide-GDP ribazoletransferase, partial [Microcystaceae cyanobacterium]